MAQILDYAKDLTQLEYGDFKARIEAAAARSGLSGSLLEIVAKGPVGLEFDGIGFEQGLRRSLASGNLLLLIVGDRIRPEVVLLSEIVGKTPHLQYTLHLVELQFYHTHPIQAWPVLTIPALVGGTHEVTRAVVKIVYEGKQPDVEVFAEEQESGTNREKTDLETFLKTLTRGLDEVFRPYLERWMAGAYKVYWGSVGFSLRLPRKGKLLTVIEGYPTNLGLFQEKQLPAWGQPMEAYHAYRAAIEDIPEVQRVYTEGRRRAFYDRLSQAELYQILEATDKLVQALRTREGEGAPSVGTLLEP